MGKSKDLATGASYVDIVGDTITGDTVISTTTQNQLRLENTAANSLGSYLKIRDGNSAAGQHTWIGRSTNDTYIYGNNNDLGMKITGGSTNGGIVTKPNQPAFRAYPTSTQANDTGASQLHSNGYVWTSLFNIGNHFNNSGTFTAPVAGRYLFIGHWTVYGADSNFGDAGYHMFIKNNNTGGNNGSYATSGMGMWDPRGSTWDQLYTGFGGSAIMDLAANDAVTMYGGVLDGGGNNLDLVGSNVWYTTIMSGYLIG